jgi:two-component system C4-dicarboxylate transport sensor histidine kinase DctB
VPLIERLNRKLARLSSKRTRAMFVIGPDGTVVASDDWDAPDTLVGRNLADRPYFAQAVADGESSYLGIEPSTNRVRFISLRRSAIPRCAVAVVRIEFDASEAAWEKRASMVVTDRMASSFCRAMPPAIPRLRPVRSPMRIARSQTDRYLAPGRRH